MSACFPLSGNKACPPTGTDRLPCSDPRERAPRKGGKEKRRPELGRASARIPCPLFPGASGPQFPPRTVPVSVVASGKVSGWPEPARTGHRQGRVKRKRRGRPPRPAPPPAQQARLREPATYVVCIAGRAGGGARRPAGICSRRFRPVLSCSALVLD